MSCGMHVLMCWPGAAQGKGPWWTAPLAASIPVATYVVGVVGAHLIMALLEKKRLENWQEKGEVPDLALTSPSWHTPALRAARLCHVICHPPRLHRRCKSTMGISPPAWPLLTLFVHTRRPGTLGWRPLVRLPQTL
jgi:hypothetical protein